MYKNVKLQGYGADSTVVNAGYFSPHKQTDWLALLDSITSNQTSTFYIIPGERPDFFLEQGSGILVLAKGRGFHRSRSCQDRRIADHGREPRQRHIRERVRALSSDHEQQRGR